MSKPVAVLGVNAYGHDSAAALIRQDGVILAAEEERFTRVKHERRFPESALHYCLEGFEDRQGGIIAGFYHNPWLNSGKRVIHTLRYLPSSAKFLFSFKEEAEGWRLMFGARRRIEAILAGRCRSFWIEHHIAHAAGAFFSSPFERAAICTLDGMGEWTSSLFAVGSGKEIIKLEECFFPHSLGIFYKTITAYLGFRPDWDEYKVMGLAAYGSPEFEDEFRRILYPVANGFYRLNLDYFSFYKGDGRLFSPLLSRRLGPPRNSGEPILNRHRNIARSAQNILMEIVLNLLRKLKAATGEKNLCMGGGIILNALLNGEIRRSSPFESVWFQPPAGDSGCTIGICCFLRHCLLREDRNGQAQQSLYLGPFYDDHAISGSLDRFGLSKVRVADPAIACAKLLSMGKVAAWFQGRMEFGPRALGNRSILADPGKSEARDHLNRVVKRREGFRPFGPSILKERAGELFEEPGDAEYMLYVVKARNRGLAEMPAAIHVDGTARIQAVSRESNPDFHRLLSEFERITGRPGVLNTSFNLKDEPIVCSPDDAADTFLRSDLDYLVAGRWLAAGSEALLQEYREIVRG